MKKLFLSIFLMLLILVFASSGQSINESSAISDSCIIGSQNNLLYAATANCTEWSIQPDGCYERVCCCDKNGQHWCERCCPDKTGKCVAYKVKC